MNEKEKKKRTTAQRKALQLYCKMVAEELNEAGLDMKRVLKPEIDIPWTMEGVKTFLWKPIQEAMFQKESTTDLNTDEVTKVYEVLNRHTAEKFGIGVQFPSIESLMFDAMLKEYKIT